MDHETLVQVLVPTGVLTTGLGVLLGHFLNRSRVHSEETKFDAEAAATITKTALLLVEPLEAKVSDLVGRVAVLEKENAQTAARLKSAIDHIRALRAWIRQHVPYPDPPTPPPGLGL